MDFPLDGLLVDFQNRWVFQSVGWGGVGEGRGVCGVVWVAFRSGLQVASGMLKYNYRCCQERKREANPQQTHIHAHTRAGFLIYLSPLSRSPPFKIERWGVPAVFLPLFCSFQECLQCLPGIPACWLWLGIKGAASSVPSADPKGDYVGLNVSPFMGRHAGSDRFPCTVLPFYQTTQNLGKNVGHVEMERTYSTWKSFFSQRSEGCFWGRGADSWSQQAAT